MLGNKVVNADINLQLKTQAGSLFLEFCSIHICDASLADRLRAASFFLNKECRSLLNALFCDLFRSYHFKGRI